MPGNILSADTGFPNLEGQSTEEKFDRITSYLFMLLEQLRYTLANLGQSNFNDTEFKNIADIITSPVYVRLGDTEQDVTELSVAAGQLTSRVTSAEGNISTLQQTAQGLTSRVTSAEGNISTLQQTAQRLTSRVTNAEGDISTLEQTVNGFTLSVQNSSGYSTLSLKSGNTTIATSGHITLGGGVVFTDDLTDGTTTISGDNIKTGTISANRIDTNSLRLRRLYDLNDELVFDASQPDTVSIGRATEENPQELLFIRTQMTAFGFGQPFVIDVDSQRVYSSNDNWQLGSTRYPWYSIHTRMLHADFIASSSDLNGVVIADAGEGIGFFGAYPVEIQSVADDATVEELIAALKAYNLIA